MGNGRSSHIENATRSSSAQSKAAADDTPLGGLSQHRRQSAPSLREGMTRARENCDPMKFYEITKMIGTGSMGGVAMVKKRPTAIGGSARPHNVIARASILDSLHDSLRKTPLVGGWFNSCMSKGSGISGRSGSHSSGRTPQLTDTDSTGRSLSSLFRSQRRKKSKDLFVTFQAEDSCTEEDCESKDDEELQTYEVFYALKSIHLNRLSDPTFAQELRNEIQLLKTLDHPYIVRPIETFEFRSQIYLVMELCSGGDLYTRDPYSEEQAARIIGCILSAISFMHSRHIVHRDLKYENCLFANKSPRSEVKLIDFGLSKAYSPDDGMISGGCGTIYSMAPECIRGRYNEKADIWSIGVLAFMLMSSYMPFYGKKRCAHAHVLSMSFCLKKSSTLQKGNIKQSISFLVPLIFILTL